MPFLPPSLCRTRAVEFATLTLEGEKPKYTVLRPEQVNDLLQEVRPDELVHLRFLPVWRRAEPVSQPSN